ncbi:zinc finger CCCH domain-containing protein 3 [Ctenodactylus gundi]
MTSPGPGRASRTPEMEEKEQLRRQIRLLQGLIDDYKNLHGNASAPGTSAASQWQPPMYHSGRAFDNSYSRPSRRGFSAHHGPQWRKKYSLVNRPSGCSDPAGDRAVRATLGTRGNQDPDSQQRVLDRQVQLSTDQKVVIKIKPPSKTGPTGPLEEYRDNLWSDQRSQDGKGEPPGGQPQTLRPGRSRGCCGGEDPILVCQKEPGKPRMVKSVSSAKSDSPPEPRRTVSESAIAVKVCFASSTLAPRSAVARPAARGATQLLGDESKSKSSGHPDEPAPSGSGVGPRPAREASLPVSCRTKFRKNNYTWVAASVKSPRATRRALSSRAASESGTKGSFGTAGKTEKPQARADPEARPRKPAMPSKPGPSPSKYKWKASSPSASSSSSFHWQAEAGSKGYASQLSPVPSRAPPADRPAVGPSSFKPILGETPFSAYKVKSRTKIVRRRASAGLPGDKKSSPAATTTTRSHISLRRRQALRGKNSPILKKTPNKGLLQVSRHRLCRLLPSRAHLPPREVSNVHTLRTPPTSKVIKTRYRIIKKTPVSPVCTPPVPLSLPSWRARRLSLSRSLVLNRLRPAITASGKTPPGCPRWRSKGYRCIGGVLYKVSANKLSKTSGRLGDGGSKALLRTGRLDPTSSCSRSLASRAVQRSLAIIRQARQKKEKRKEYCMYYNRFGRCNRGERCPYIHDPEKVAVCTRFVRGTCKKTDGTCPFSHHVSKEKMPVCSYFLKGICSNSNCPYSHVYVSRKAEVCRDFLKGYCPLGAKCKKKHTLLCPDFARRGACPRGTQCQLLHRNQKCRGRRPAPSPTAEPRDAAPRSRASSGPGSRKSSAAQRPNRKLPSPPAARDASPVSPLPSPQGLAPASLLSSKGASSSCCSSSPCSDPEEPSVQETATPSGSLHKLPSFISLRSTPSPGSQPQPQPLAPRSPHPKEPGCRLAQALEAPFGQRHARVWRQQPGKPLHIKPRL